MKSFRDIPLNLRVEYIKALPKGYALTYHNNKSRFDGDIVIKIADHNWLCIVELNGIKTPLHYKNLCCEEFDKMIAVTNRINKT